MSKMKEVMTEIFGRHEKLSAKAAEVYREAGYDFETAVVYYGGNLIWYLLVVDGVPQSPWLQYNAMVRLLDSRLAPAVDGGEKAAKFEASQSWKNYPRGEWEL